METGGPERIKLFLEVVDPEVVVELAKRDDGSDRDRFALSALRLGVLALRNARGELDAQTVRQEGERLLSQVKETLTDHANKVTGEVAAALKQYLDPSTGALQQRLDHLTKTDGELDGLLARHLNGDNSYLAKTLAEHVGKSSPIFKLLSPDEQGSFLKSLEASVATLLEDQQKKVAAEFSLDNPASALTRLVRELTDANGRLRADFVKNVDSVKAQFSLDDPESALSRLVRQVDAAQRGITEQFSLDDPASSLSRLQRALEKLIEGLAEGQREFETEIRATLAALQARKHEAARSTRHGGAFEDNVCEVLGAEVRRLGDIGTPCGATVGLIKNCKVGDFIIELGPESAAPGQRIVVEAKAANGYAITDARAELDTGRKNRGAHIGIFVFSKTYATPWRGHSWSQGRSRPAALRPTSPLSMPPCLRSVRTPRALKRSWRRPGRSLMPTTGSLSAPDWPRTVY